jgi:hypothetical protein
LAAATKAAADAAEALARNALRSGATKAWETEAIEARMRIAVTFIVMYVAAKAIEDCEISLQEEFGVGVASHSHYVVFVLFAVCSHVSCFTDPPTRLHALSCCVIARVVVMCVSQNVDRETRVLPRVCFQFQVTRWGLLVRPRAVSSLNKVKSCHRLTHSGDYSPVNKKLGSRGGKTDRRKDK